MSKQGTKKFNCNHPILDHLERQRNGIPGSEHDDWERAERDLQNHHARPQAASGRKMKRTQKPAKSVKSPSKILKTNAPNRSGMVTEIKGIGPRVASELESVGVTTCSQLAQWTLSDFGEKLPRLTARARSGEWIEQAKTLSIES